MKRLIAVCTALLLAPLSSAAQFDQCDQPEAACILDAAWGAALVLPDEKRSLLADAFLEVANLSADPVIIARWETRFERPADRLRTFPDYGWQTAEPLLNAHGVEGLIDLARQRAAPLSFGRADVLLSAGKHYRQSEPEKAARLNQALLDMMQSASKFEKPSLAHAAAELAMTRCDGDLLARAVALTDAPRNLRYAFWRARVEGNSLSLLSRIRAIDNIEDTRDIRRILDGYRAILELGYCPSDKSAIGE